MKNEYIFPCCWSEVELCVGSTNHYVLKNKKPRLKLSQGFSCFIGGRNRIRTGVEGFADPCLASRPSDLF